MNKLTALVLVALVAQSCAIQSYGTGALVPLDQEAGLHHSRKVLQIGNGNLINAAASFINGLISLFSLGSIQPNSSVIIGNGSITANVDVKLTNLLNPSDNTVIKSSTGIVNNTIYSYTNSSTQIKDGIYGLLTGNSSKYITTNLGGAVGAGVNGAQITGGKNELYVNGTGNPTKLEIFQGSLQLQPNTSLYGFININTARNISNSGGQLVNPFPGTTGQQANVSRPFGR